MSVNKISMTTPFYELGGLIFKVCVKNNHQFLITDIDECIDIEYKKFGKLQSLYGNEEINIKFNYQLDEIEKQITVFLNTNGGKLYLGISDSNHALLGGEYNPDDQIVLSSYIHKISEKLGVTKDNLIEEPEFFEVPSQYHIFNCSKNYKRYLVVISVKRSFDKIFAYNGINYYRYDASNYDQNGYIKAKYFNNQNTCIQQSEMKTSEMKTNSTLSYKKNKLPFNDNTNLSSPYFANYRKT